MGSTGDMGREQGRLQLVFCGSAEDKPGGLDLEGRRGY